MTHIFYNPFSGNGEGKVRAEEVKKFYEGKETEFVDMTSVDYGAFFAGLPEGDDICICGGDGTLNRFVNDTDDIEKKCDIFYFATGTGSDFWHELGYKPGDAPIKVNEYLADLPIVEIAGKRMRVLNGVGYGIDGYCCEVADVIREKDPGSKINYAGIAIKGLLFHFKPVRATVTVDGVEHVIEKTWIAPTMNGKCYGGGMMPTPAQDRLDPNRKLTTMLMHGKGRIATLIIFPKIFKGEHVKHTGSVTSFTGRDITVKFDRPVAAQVDGETVLNVTEYHITK
ncbi:MAG: diacylglycerol kinase family protein [Clostridia bacterium]|nr:diacylglycerol kinase family protein [Clostridia bacterium]